MYRSNIHTNRPISSYVLISYVMRQDFPTFDMAQTLSNVLSGFSIDLGVHGELLVFAFFTWARDNAIVKQPAPPLSEIAVTSRSRNCLMSLLQANWQINVQRKPPIGTIER